MSDASDRRLQAHKIVRRSPSIAAHRLSELTRQLAEDDLTDGARALKQIAAESLAEAMTSAQRCRRCGAPLTDPISRSVGVGPVCLTKGAA